MRDSFKEVRVEKTGMAVCSRFSFSGNWVDIIHPQTRNPKASKSVIPKTWDDAEMAALEIPLANPIGSLKQVPADYYYRIPVRSN